MQGDRRHAAQNGLLVRDRRGLEEARTINAVFFDKTGTLTRGEFRVVDITTRPGLAPEEALALAAAVERDSEHTIARGIVKSAEERRIDFPKAEGFEALPGHSEATYRKMIQNLWWAAGYNIVAIPLAAGLLAPWGAPCHPPSAQS